MTTRTVLAKALPAVLVVAVVILALVFAYFIRQKLGDKPVQQKKMVQQVTIIAPPPPSPPPPPEEPEPEVEEPIEEQPMEEAMPDEPMDEAPAADLGVDGDASAGSDGFGLVARKGGRSMLGGGSPYATEVQTSITDVLSADDRLRHMGYVAVLKLWIDESGKLKRYEVQQREGKPEVEALLKNALASVDRFENPPPLELPQPIKLRIRSQL